MTARDLSAMTDDALNAEAARLQGWSLSRTGDDYFYFVMPDGGHRTIHNPPYKELSLHSMEYSPSTDLNHAAQFGAAFLAAHPGKGLDIHIHLHKKKPEFGGNVSVGAHVWPSPAGDWESTGPSEARCRTEAVCAAWLALEGERG